MTNCEHKWIYICEKCGIKRKTTQSKDEKLELLELYAHYKQVDWDDAAKRHSFIKRNIRATELLQGYDLVKIEEIMIWLNKNADFKWALESVAKYIDEDLEKLSLKLSGGFMCQYGYTHKKGETCGHTHLYK